MSMSPSHQAAIIFPVRVVTGRETLVERNGRSRRCSQRLWFADWHEARRRGVDGRMSVHHAQDLFAPAGSEILAPESGRIIGSSTTSGPTPRGGHWLRLRAISGRAWYMAHLDGPPAVRLRDMVEAGQLVGCVGRSGNATHACPHLHVSVRGRDGRSMNIYSELIAARDAAGPTEAQAHPPGPTKATEATG